jgi:tryptophan-rich sensory protein
VSTWYRTLAKPSFTPPAWVFGPVWTALYLTMAIAVWQVWLRRGFAGAPGAMAAFAVQLLLNALWSLLFFGLRRPDLALADIALLWLALVATVLTFSRVSAPAGALLLPYLAWVSFASVLNFAIWQLNR